MFSRQATCRLFCACLFAFLALLGSSFLTNRINASVAPIIAGLFTLLVGFGPFMAAILVVKVNGGSVKQWLRQIFVRKVKFHWYLVALVIPIAIINVCGELYALMGGDVVGGFDLNLLAILIPLFLFNTLLGGGQEELGWRGFALPKLQEKYNALSASIILGFCMRSGTYRCLLFLGLIKRTLLSFTIF